LCEREIAEKKLLKNKKNFEPQMKGEEKRKERRRVEKSAGKRMFPPFSFFYI